MHLTDTHCHLYLEDFNPDINLVMERAATEAVDKFFLPAIDSTTLAAMLSLEDRFPLQCKAMIGLHPCSVKENYRKELQLVADSLASRRFIGVGEIGMDLYWDTSFRKEQEEAFRTQIQWSLQYGLPISIHTRNAIDEAIAIVREYVPQGVRGVFHCFGGSYEQATQVIDAGFCLGIGGVITYKNSGLAAVMEKIGLEHLVLETDAPYLTPVPFRGKRNESSYLKYIAARLAAVKNCSIDEVAEVTTANAEKIFGA